MENNELLTIPILVTMLSPRFILLSLAALFAALPALGQGMRCSQYPFLAPYLRPEGLAEPIADIRASCTGGTPTPNGQAVPQVDLVVTLNTPITSRLTADPYTEVLLLIDEPHSPTNPSVPLRVCDSNNASSGICSITGNGTGLGTYDGSPGHPNVFQGRLIAPNQVMFTAVPIDPPAAGRERSLRVTNLRANAAFLRSDSSYPGVIGAMAASPATSLLLSPGGLYMGQVLSNLASSAGTPATLNVCSGANTVVYNDISRPLGTGTQDGQQFSVSFPDAFSALWKERNIAFHIANAGSSLSFPADASQDMPGSLYRTESGFESVGVSPAAVPWGYEPFLPAASAFPSVRGLNLAGTADHGTRIYLRFSGIPTGVKVLVPVMFNASTSSVAEAGIGKAVLISSTGSAPFSPVPGNVAGLASLVVDSGVATAIYEVAYRGLFNRGAVVPVAVAFNAGQASAGTVSVSAGFGPWSTVGTAAAGLPIPRFAAPTGQQLAFSLAACGSSPELAVSITHTGSFAQGQRGATYSVTVANGRLATPASGTVTVTESIPNGLALVSMAGTGWTCSGMSCNRSDALAPGASYPAITVTVDVAANAASPQVNSVSVSGGGAAATSATDSTMILPGSAAGPSPTQALSFYPIAPCRVADTRASQGKTGAFGPPFLPANTSRDFPVVSSPCGIPAAARAYSLNMTVIPPAALDYLSAYPAGQSFPGVSTLNSPAGTVIANAAIVPAGTNGAVTVLSRQKTELVIDANGYFAPSGTSELLFYPMTPCRVMDTRAGQGKYGLFGPPTLVDNVTRDIPMLSSACNIPATAQAFALNVTVVPLGGLGYLSLWPAGQAFPGVSTLNSPDGSILANAAIVRAGANGAVSLFTSNATDVIVDVNGYFAPPAAGGLHFYPMTPCRVADTRADQGKPGSFGPPALTTEGTRSFPITASACGVPGRRRRTR